MSATEDVLNKHIRAAAARVKYYESDRSDSGRRSWNYATHLHDELLKVRAEIQSLIKESAK
jgi:hypothetical protein